MRYALREYFFKTILSSRFLITLLVLFLGVYGVFSPMAEKTAQADLSVGALEMLPCFLFGGNGALIYFAVFLFLVLIYPQWDGATNLLVRQGKKSWMRCQYFSIFLTAILYYLVWTVIFLLVFFQSISFQNEWSSLVQLAVSGSDVFIDEIAANVNCYYSEQLMELSNPAAVWAMTFLVHVLCSALLGFVSLTFNVCFRRGAGTFIAFLLAASTNFFEGFEYFFYQEIFPFEGIERVKNLFLRLQMYLSPLCQCDVSLMAYHDARPLAQRMEIAVLYYVILITALLLFGRWRFKKLDFTQN